MQKFIRKLSYTSFFIVLCILTIFSTTVKAQNVDCNINQQSQTQLEKDKKNTLVPYTNLNSTLALPVNERQYQCLANRYLTNRDVNDRNRLIFIAVSQIDLFFGSYEKKKRNRINLFQTVINILEVGAATAISITNGERAKTIIADALGFIQGSRDSINKNYRLLERQALLNTMVKKRAEVLKGIYEKVGKSDNEYSFEQAWVDIVAYYQAGTIDNALTSLLNDTGEGANNAITDLNDAKRNANITLPPSPEQIKLARENEVLIQSILNKWRDADRLVKSSDEKFKAAEKVKKAEEEKQNPDAAVIEKAKQDMEKAKSEQKQAEEARTAELKKLKDIFTSIEQDAVLLPLLNKLPERFPDTAGMIQDIRDGNGDINDYGFTIKSFYVYLLDVKTNDSTVVTRAKNILESLD